MINNKTTPTLRFEGSVWCNLDIALRSVDQLFRQMIQPSELTVIEWYILRSLYEEDGQHASELAHAVGRAATSFTPNLDKLQNKGYIERRPDKSDRRAVRIFLTETAKKHKNDVEESARRLDEEFEKLFGKTELDTFQEVVSKLQALASK